HIEALLQRVETKDLVLAPSGSERGARTKAIYGRRAQRKAGRGSLGAQEMAPVTLPLPSRLPCKSAASHTSSSSAWVIGARHSATPIEAETPREPSGNSTLRMRAKARPAAATALSRSALGRITTNSSP